MSNELSAFNYELRNNTVKQPITKLDTHISYLKKIYFFQISYLFFTKATT